jgi:hypothetical protein
MMPGEGADYREFNFSPSGEWAVYDFHEYRNSNEKANVQNSLLLTKHPPVIKVHKSIDTLELGVEIDQGLLPQGDSLKLGLSVVVENVAGIKSYWAIRHPPGKPDFHHADAFALQMRRVE